MHSPPLTIGDAARRIADKTQHPIDPWQIRRVITRGLLPEPDRVGAFRIFYDDDLPAIETALRDAGYLPQEEVVNA